MTENKVLGGKCDRLDVEGAKHSSTEEAHKVTNGNEMTSRRDLHTEVARSH